MGSPYWRVGVPPEANVRNVNTGMSDLEESMGADKEVLPIWWITCGVWPNT
jgi:hypothetical protein